MNVDKKIALLQKLNQDEMPRVGFFYEILEQCGALKTNYTEYSTTHPIDCDTELTRLPTADYDLCCALLTMLLREDYFCNGSFERRKLRGQVKPIVARMIEVLSNIQRN